MNDELIAEARAAIASYRKAALKGVHNERLLARATTLARRVEAATDGKVTLTTLLEEHK